MEEYYQARAPEYEAFYHYPERQTDLAEVKIWLREQTHGRTILEIACGTGYWTAEVAGEAKLILATDFNSAPLDIARAKGMGGNVRFEQSDAYNLPDYDEGFDCGMAHFWWSHVAKSRRDEFLSHFASRLGNGATILMIDNNYVPGSNIPLSHEDEEGNTYQMRTLANGDTYEIVKNFPDTGELECALERHCESVDVFQWQYFWAVKGVLGKAW